MLGVCSLFIPASAPRMINASFSFQADSLIFDLEDAVHAEEKDSARTLLFYALPHFEGRNIAVRINCQEGCWRDDIELLRSGQVKTLVVPKARASFILELSDILEDMGADTDIAALIESAESLEQLSDIACASPRVTSLLMGGEDYSLDLGTDRTIGGEEILYARMKIANVAAAYRLEALDTPFADTDDMQGLKNDSTYAKKLGFSGKLAINPLQISVIHNVFYPTDKEIQWAMAISEAVNKPENKGKGAFPLHGKMVDLPIIKRAELILARSASRGGGTC